VNLRRSWRRSTQGPAGGCGQRILAWLTAHRRFACDYERDPAVAEPMIGWAAISGMLDRLSRDLPAARQPAT
jgi:hypothetical protein